MVFPPKTSFTVQRKSIYRKLIFNSDTYTSIMVIVQSIMIINKFLRGNISSKCKLYLNVLTLNHDMHVMFDVFTDILDVVIVRHGKQGTTLRTKRGGEICPAHGKCEGYDIQDWPQSLASSKSEVEFVTCVEARNFD